MSVDRLTHFLNLEELDTTNVEKKMPEHSESTLIAIRTFLSCVLFGLSVFLSGIKITTFYVNKERHLYHGFRKQRLYLNI